ncbi:MAG: hypothetical protein HZB19_05750 [Chloroflexi bacterium]|nr:hypothetical protein [Chloroflexota bacterium]
MRNFAFVIIGAVVLFLPIVLVLFRQPLASFYVNVLRQQSNKAVSSSTYTAQSNVPGYKLTLADTRYLDYMSGKFEIFKEKGVIASQAYMDSENKALRHTVSRIKFLLVPIVDTPLISFSGEKTFVAMGDYTVDGDTLVVRVYLDTTELSKGPSKYNLETYYMKTALIMLAHAQGLPGRSLKSSATHDIGKDIKDNLISGLFIWPIRIEETE